nr:hypothetical protein CFP56_01639 [Quercus suber]
MVSIQGMEVDNIGDIPSRATTTDGVPLAALPSSSSNVGMEVDNIGDIPSRPTTTDGVPLAALPSSSSEVVVQVDQENLNFKSILDTKYVEKHSYSLHR